MAQWIRFALFAQQDTLSEMTRSLLWSLAALLAGCGTAPTVQAPDCGPESFGVSRVLEVSTESGPIEPLLGPKEVVLTYDDGPHRSRTVSVLNALASQCVTATFFVQGDNSRQNPAIVRAIAENGHSIGGHSMTHLNLALLPLDEGVKDALDGIAETNAALGDAGATRLFRFPFVASTPELSARIKSAGLIEIGVTVDGKDWTGNAAEEIVDIIMTGLEAGPGRGVILLHDPFDDSLRATQLLLRRLKEEGYEIVALKVAEND